MAKTADVIQAIWTDPWFLALPVDAKCLYLWAISSEHSNLAGVFTVAAPVIQLETGLTPGRLEAAVEALDGKLFYRRESGAVWVQGRAKRVRSKTKQIAKSIIKAVEECPEPDFIAAFIGKYGNEVWLSDAFSDSALDVDSIEPHVNLSEVPSHSHSQSLSSKDVVVKEEAPDLDAIPEGYPAHLIPSVEGALPILRRVAGLKRAKPVTRLAVARAIESYPDRDHVAVAGDLEGWHLGKAQGRRVKDVASQYRNFLKNADAIAPRTRLNVVDYDANAKEYAV